MHLFLSLCVYAFKKLHEVCVRVCSALIWCLNKWPFPRGVSWQYITVETMELPSSSSPETSHLPAHAWPCGIHGPAEQCTDKWCIETHTPSLHSHITCNPFIYFSFHSLICYLYIFVLCHSIFKLLFFCFFSASSPLSPMQYFPLRKVKWLTVTLSKLAYSEVSKTTLWVYWEKAWSDPLREERQPEEKRRNKQKNKNKTSSRKLCNGKQATAV